MSKKTWYLRLDEDLVKDVTRIRRWLENEQEEADEESDEENRFGLENGICYRFDFDNKYGASVIKHGGSYGFEEDLWEVAVLFDGELNYDTPVTCDVEGYCNDKEVNRILQFLKNYDGNSNVEFEFRDEFLNQEES